MYLFNTHTYAHSTQRNMAGGGEDSFIEPLGLLLGLTALVALVLSYAKQSTIIAFITVGLVVTSSGVHVETTTLGHFSEVGILILLFMAGLEVELEAFIQKWKTVTIIGVGQIVCSTAFFALTSIAVLPAIGAKVTTNAAVYFGLCMCFSSTILVLGYLKNAWLQKITLRRKPSSLYTPRPAAPAPIPKRDCHPSDRLARASNMIGSCDGSTHAFVKTSPGHSPNHETRQRSRHVGARSPLLCVAPNE